jgi:hypothetical protein
MWFQVVAVLAAVISSVLLGRVLGGQLCFRSSAVGPVVMLSPVLADVDACSPQASPEPTALVVKR